VLEKASKKIGPLGLAYPCKWEAVFFILVQNRIRRSLLQRKRGVQFKAVSFHSSFSGFLKVPVITMI
jgi:hypothetical protein